MVNEENGVSVGVVVRTRGGRRERERHIGSRRGLRIWSRLRLEKDQREQEWMNGSRRKKFDKVGRVKGMMAVRGKGMKERGGWR